MTTEPNKRFPSVLSTFCAVIETRDINIPDEINKIAKASQKALLRNNPRMSLNRQFIGLKKAYPNLFPISVEWLRNDAVARLFSKYGAHWARMFLINAFTEISLNVTPHIALNMAVAGRPQNWSFCTMQDAAILAQHYHLNKGMKITEAKTLAAEKFGTDRSNLRKYELNLTPDEAAIQAKLIFLKYQMQ